MADDIPSLTAQAEKICEQFKAIARRFTTERLRIRRVLATLVITCDGCRIEED